MNGKHVYSAESRCLITNLGLRLGALCLALAAGETSHTWERRRESLVQTGVLKGKRQNIKMGIREATVDRGRALGSNAQHTPHRLVFFGVFLLVRLELVVPLPRCAARRAPHVALWATAAAAVGA